MFNKVGLVAKSGDERVEETIGALIAYLNARNTEFLVHTDCAREFPGERLPPSNLVSIGEQCDLTIVVGGDGTLLSAARALVGYDMPLVGVNLGRLGFLTDILPAEIEARLDAVFAGQFQEEDRFMLDCVIVRGGHEILHGDALNDVVVHKWKIARLVKLETYVDGIFVHTQRSDGLIVSTPTGSTAYALSGGGPILHPSLNAMVLVPICPHTLSNRPIVVGGDSRIEVLLTEEQQTCAQLTFDGQLAMELEVGDRVVVRKKQRPVRLIHPADHDYYAMLRTKLQWGKEL